MRKLQRVLSDARFNGNGKRIDAYYHNRIYMYNSRKKHANVCVRIRSMLSPCQDTFLPNRTRAGIFFPIFAVVIREALDPFSECDTMKLD